jgi:hypothetical protein
MNNALASDHAEGPKTDRRTAIASIMSHNARRARWDYCQLIAKWRVANIDLVGGSAIASEVTSTNKSGRGNQ